MAFLTDPVLGLQYGGDRGEDWEDEGNLNLKRLAALHSPLVLGLEIDTPPGAPSNGDRYVLGAAPTGVWSGQADKLAIYIEGAWEFHPIPDGQKVWDSATSAEYVKTLATDPWVKIAEEIP